MTAAPIRAAEDPAWAKLALEARPALVGLARRLVRDTGEAADLADEAIARLTGELDRGKTVDEPGAWLRRTVLRLSIDRARRSEREARLEPRRRKHAPRSPDQLAERRELSEWIRERVLALPTRQRDVVILRDLEGCSYDEIARTLDIQPSTARAHAHAGRETLRQELERWKRD
ncbi:MAG: sigma-70 family RNA polymerase sigma factor [Planctomycetota bacterium]